MITLKIEVDIMPMAAGVAQQVSSLSLWVTTCWVARASVALLTPVMRANKSYASQRKTSSN